MRLVDADELLKALQYNTKTLIGEIRDVNSLVAVDVNTMIGYIEKMPTAYDVEAVVAELEAMKEKSSGCVEIWCDECKYNESCLQGEEGYKVALDNAIEIVRGKE